ncbi:hypothetical protein [Flavobacterium sp. NKUCC04_CG]|uniref:hypothetical protein n=1 Tax=Flavobacterium sp. NKUCC04_CG TaxID=2842121 RepID=UPI001C5A5C40|nr:hypothetical protein [Flavobacterium sp. NKUCC04_CG]MBW3519877.1 hypothetical protein [Flavobacterium sp. NKUCC04_CG]
MRNSKVKYKVKTIVIGTVKPSIDVVKRLVDELGTTVGYLLGETSQINILKNPEMLHRLNEIDDLPEEDKAPAAARILSCGTCTSTILNKKHFLHDITFR